MKASLKDIAELLKVSKTTVSWSLSGKGDEHGISNATQEKVREAAKKLNYQPNLIARSLNTGSTRTFGLIIPDITDSFYSEVTSCIEKSAEKAGYYVMIGNSEAKAERENYLIQMFKAKQVDGIILAPTKISRVETDKLIKEHFPFVFFDRYYPEIKTNYVIVDNEDSSYQLVKKMIKRGCKKIAIITTNSHLRTMNMRREGYSNALLESGIELDQNLYGEVPFNNYQEMIYPVLDHIMRSVPDTDGFFFTTHILCLAAFKYFHDKNINYHTYELACIHGMPAFQCIAPSMQIARMPVEKIAEESVKTLIDNINFRKKYTDADFPVREVSLKCTFY
jgi:LacI family transcriptional regulator